MGIKIGGTGICATKATSYGDPLDPTSVGPGTLHPIGISYEDVIRMIFHMPSVNIEASISGYYHYFGGGGFAYDEAYSVQSNTIINPTINPEECGCYLPLVADVPFEYSSSPLEPFITTFNFQPNSYPGMLGAQIYYYEGLYYPLIFLCINGPLVYSSVYTPPGVTGTCTLEEIDPLQSVSGDFSFMGKSAPITFAAGNGSIEFSFATVNVTITPNFSV